MNDDAIFKALADANRRTLLDALQQEDGQTLTQLCTYLEMTRYGVMKHLGVLEDAGLLTTKKVGREKHHYLNAVPIQQIYDRWVHKYAQPFATQMTWLKHTLENTAMAKKPVHIMHIFIRTTPEKLWDALTNGDQTQKYYMGTRVESSWEAGAPYVYRMPDGSPMLDGTVVEAIPYTRLVTTFNALWGPEDERGEETTVIYELEPVGDAVKLTLTHEGLDPAHPTMSGIASGWGQITSSLKSLLETGEALNLNTM